MSWAVRACWSWVAMMARTRWAASRLVPRRATCTPRGGLGVLMLAFPGQALVQMRGVGVAAAGQRHVQQGAGGGVAEHGVGGVGGDALGGVHGDGVAVGDVLAQVLTGKGGPGAIRQPARGDAMVFGVDGVDAPAVAVAHRVGGLVDVGGVVDAQGRVGSLRRLMITSPTPTRCPRAAVTVGASASIVSSWRRRFSASHISVVSHTNSASLPIVMSAR